MRKPKDNIPITFEKPCLEHQNNAIADQTGPPREPGLTSELNAAWDSMRLG